MKAVPTVVLGFAASGALAASVVWLRALAFPLPSAEASGGMAVFGDLLLFGGAFSLFAIIPTVGLLRALEASPTFWKVWSSVAALITATGLMAGVVYLAPSNTLPQQLHMINVLSPLRLLGAVPLAIGFILSALHAPESAIKKVFLSCAGIECVALAAAFVKLLVSTA
jgi:hypothetical protein